MQVKNEELMKIIERLGEHYKANINNRAMRVALLKMDLDNTTWDRIERLTEVSDYQRNEGYSIHELYEHILAIALFVDYSRRRLLPNIRALLAEDAGFGGGSRNDRVLRDMAVSNFRSNLTLLADMVKELYAKTLELDRELAKGKKPVSSGIPELARLTQLLG